MMSCNYAPAQLVLLFDQQQMQINEPQQRIDASLSFQSWR
jgi:hypothetical protein